VVVIVLLVVGSITWTYLRRKRARGETPKFLPKALSKRWHSWRPKQKYASVGDGHRSGLNASTSYETEERAASQAAAAGVDRHTSVRSVMTLPAYSQNPNESETVLGREGERGNMDTVIEFPETHEEEETRRDEQMESLYQIRLQRRREVAEREERRRERREARERGDFARLEELRRESRVRANNESTATLDPNAPNGGLSVSAATMIAEHQSRGRDRRVSSVAYGDVGTARHDGTRVRANSGESERGGLLDNAAPMGDDASSLRPSTLSRPSHQRERSGSSALSISSNASDIEATPTTTQAGSTTTTSHTQPPRTSDSAGTDSSSSPTANRFTPDESTEGENDIGESRIPPLTTDLTIFPTNHDSPLPPDYSPPSEWGEAPAYMERQRSLRLQEQQRRHQQQTQGGGVRRNDSQRAFDELARASRTPTVASIREGSNSAGGSGGLVRTSTNPPRIPQLELPSISVEAATAENSPLSPRMNMGETEGQSEARNSSRGRRSRYDQEEFMA
jgi:hypothetical protein